MSSWQLGPTDRSLPIQAQPSSLEAWPIGHSRQTTATPSDPTAAVLSNQTTMSAVRAAGATSLLSPPEPSRGVLLRPAGNPEQKYGDARTGQARRLGLRGSSCATALAKDFCIGPSASSEYASTPCASLANTGSRPASRSRPAFVSARFFGGLGRHGDSDRVIALPTPRRTRLPRYAGRARRPPGRRPATRSAGPSPLGPTGAR